MQHFVRNADGDEIVFVHSGREPGKPITACCAMNQATIWSFRKAPPIASMWIIRRSQVCF